MNRSIASALFAEQAGQSSPLAELGPGLSFANVLENEPNDEGGFRQRRLSTFLLASTAPLNKPGEADWFKFTAKKASRSRSPFTRGVCARRSIPCSTSLRLERREHHAPTMTAT